MNKLEYFNENVVNREFLVYPQSVFNPSNLPYNSEYVSRGMVIGSGFPQVNQNQYLQY